MNDLLMIPCMLRKYFYTVLAVIVLCFCNSCKSQLDRIKENPSAEVRYREATKLLAEGKRLYAAKQRGAYKCFNAAKELFESVKDALKGSSKSEDVLYGWATAAYYAGDDLFTARMLFKTLATEFPNSIHSEEANFMVAKCLFEEAPKDYSLDQSLTYQALEAIDWLFDLFPNSRYTPECNAMSRILVARLQKKSFEAAKLYYTIQAYRASVVALNNALIEFPDTPYREEIEYLITQSMLKYALQSSEEKQKERATSAIKACELFLANYATSTRVPEVLKAKAAAEMLIR